MSSITLQCCRCGVALACVSTTQGELVLCDTCRGAGPLSASTVAAADEGLRKPVGEEKSTLGWNEAQEPETVVHQAAASPAAPGGLGEVPGFELLDVLGRGGMGVVYKARHLKLNRLVALKMILAGEHAGPDQVQRFLAEARAVAKLQHPNIVQVHEIGEYKNLPYLALEYVAGGSLAQAWKRARPSAADLAALAESLAQAMHVAHQHNIIHRDLKPANILLAADGPPKIGDFGLAKQLGEGHLGESQPGEGLETVSGAVLGTPSYMAPEQARGQLRLLGPGTDVYSFGAILYTGLTGQPPFQGETTIDILQQVTGHEPVRPSKRAPHVPRNLEIICLKCLRKTPAERTRARRRWPRAVRRFRAGEPIQARPAGYGERLWKWARRRPAIAGLVGMAVVAISLLLAVVAIRQQAEQVQERADQQQQVTKLTQEVDAGLELPVWNPAHVRHLETLLDDLKRLAPPQATAARQRLEVRLAEVIRDSFSFARKPVLNPDDVPPIEALIHLLEERAPQVAQLVRQEMQNRLGTMQMVINLKASAQDAGTVFPGRTFEEKGKLLYVKPAKGKFDPVLLANISCPRNVEMEVIYEYPGWDIRGPLGLVVQGAKDRGYRFQLQVADPPLQDEALPNEALPGEALPAPKQNARTFADAMRSNGLVVLQIFRNKLRLKTFEVPAGKVWPKESHNGPLRMRVKRYGEKLAFHCNDVKLEFEDALPLSVKEGGVFGLVQPAGVGMAGMRARRRMCHCRRVLWSAATSFCANRLPRPGLNTTCKRKRRPIRKSVRKPSTRKRSAS